MTSTSRSDSHYNMCIVLLAGRGRRVYLAVTGISKPNDFTCSSIKGCDWVQEKDKAVELA